MVGHLSLRRDHHSSDLVASLHDILEANSLVDCVISAEGQYLKAHKLILSACSPYFQLLFREETDKYPIAIFKDIEFEYLKLIIHFVYCGEVQVLDTQLNAFLEVAKFLQIKGLNSSSRECSPERTFSEPPGNTNILENELNTVRATNAIIVEDDDCQVIDLAGDTAVEVQELLCEDGAERPLMGTDESTFSLASPAAQDFVRAAEQEWHSRPVSPVSVISITSVKTEQLVDCDDMSGRSGTCSENENLNEHMEGIELDELPPANGSQKLDNSWKRASSFRGRSVGQSNAAAAAKKEVRAQAASPPPEDSDLVAAPESTQRGLVSRQRQRYKCAECNQSFEFRSLLKMHLRLHTGERPYSCPECHQAFAVLNTLKKHMVTHSTKRPYKCPRCDMQFALLSHLKSHLKVHTGVKPYKCSVCPYVTAYSSALIRHKRSHTGERPYKCPECDYAAMCSANLVTHRRTHDRARRLQAEQADAAARAKAAAQAPKPSSSC